MNKRNRVIALVLVVAIAIASFPMAALAATYGTMTAANVNLRKTASTSSASLGKLSKNQKVEVVSKSGDWFKIKANGKTGYVMKSFVTLTSGTTAATTTTNKKPAATTTTTKSTTTGTAKAAATVYKTAKAASTNKLTTVKKGATFPVQAQTASFYKITVNGKTGYIAKNAVTIKKSTASQTETLKKAKTRPGDKVGYTTSTISKPADVVTGKQQVLNAINWNLKEMNTSFTLKIKNFDESMMPSKMSELERMFVAELNRSDNKALADNVTQIDYTVKYNEAGLVVLDMVKGKAIPASETRALELKKETQKILDTVKGKSDVEKVIALHDYVVLKAAYDESDSADKRTPYGVLIKGVANCQGYAETMQLLYTTAGIENRFVWASSRLSATGTHGFNKVKVDGKWYNVDATVDDPIDRNKQYTDRVRHDYLLVTDAVASQRYSFEYARYPAANTKNNWHTRNKLVATSQAQLESLVKAGVNKKQKYVSVWVDNYSANNYKTGFVSKLPNVKDSKVSVVASYDTTKPYATAIMFQITYK